MKLVLINATGSVSGAERVLLRLADEALRRGDDVVLVAPDGPIVEQLDSRITHRSCRPIGLGGLRSPISVLKYVASLLGAAAVLLPYTRSADVLVINNTLASPLGFVFSKRFVWLLHDVLGDDLRGSIGKAASRFFRLVIPVSHAAAHPLPKGTISRVVLNGTPVRGTEDALRQDGAAVTIGCLAALTPWKGHKTLIEAVGHIKDLDFSLEIAGGTFPGDEAYAVQLQTMANKSPVRHRIHFLGNVDSYSTLQRWDVMVLPSVEPEALPLSVLEALSMGVPCISTNIGGSLEILKDLDGELVPPNDPLALAESIRLLANDEYRRKALGKAGRDLITAKYSLVDRTRELYKVVSGSQ